MGCRLPAALFVVLALAGSKRGFVDSTPLKLSNVVVGDKFNDETVRELESLKGIFGEVKDDNENGNEVSISKSQTSIFSVVNGSKTAHEEFNNEVDKNGKMFAKLTEKIDVLKNKEEKPKSASQLEVEIPSEGIHKVIKSGSDAEVIQEKKEGRTLGLKKIRSGIDKIDSFSEIKYNPHEMAEYIFWTGNEKGVALTVEEFLREGLMSRQEAINFLQSIKYNLDLMQSYYQRIKKVDKIYSQGKTTLKHKLFGKKFVEKSKESLYDEQDNMKFSPAGLLNIKSLSPEVMSVDTNMKQNSYFFGQMNSPNGDSSMQDYSEQKNKSFPKSSAQPKILERESINDVYDEIVERIKEADLLQKEYALEEVIFELAKIMFSESLTKGNAEAQKALQKFSNFLQNQVQNGQISRNLQRKILDILLSALMDSLSDHPELLNRPMEELQIVLDQNSPTLEALKQLLMLGSKPLPNQVNPKEELSKKLLLSGKRKLSSKLLKKV